MNVLPCRFAVYVLVTVASWAILPGWTVAQSPQLNVQPFAVSLSGSRSEQQLIVTQNNGKGLLQDRTHQAIYTALQPKIATVSPTGLVTPHRNGNTTVAIRVGDLVASATVTVTGFDRPDPVKFDTQVIPLLTKFGCNSGACHGTPTGKGGFRLSLRGYLPDQDFLSLTRDVLGRRTNPWRPEDSLLLRKATGSVPHEGGVRFPVGSPAYRLLRDWIGEGSQATANPAKLLRLEIFPPPRLLEMPAEEQQLAVTAVFADGARRDVTNLARFSVNNRDVAEVSADGWVSAHKMGEVTVLAGFLHEMATTRLTFLRPVPKLVWQAPPEKNFVDRHVFAKLKLLRIQPAELASDEVFLRRVFLDVCGILPTPAERQKFLADTAPDKRARLIDALLERPEYADFWALKWVDRLGCNNRFVGQRGAYSYRQWIFQQINQNVPFDQFVRDLITASGPSYSQPAASFYRRIRDPESRVEAVSHLFLGVRIGCARCHNHPAERWTQDDYYGLAAFFARVRYKNGPFFQGIYNKEETIWLDRQGDLLHPRTGQILAPKVLGGKALQIGDHQDPRAELAKWVTSPDNPFFARVAVNRVWHHVMGRGIVEPVDDFRESNPPCNPELLDELAADFVKHKFDLKHTLRRILNSSTYQLDSAPNPFNKHDDTYFSHYRIRRLTAEQLVDCVCQITEVPEKFAGVPLGTRAAQLPDGEAMHPFMSVFGKPARAIECECERGRPDDATLAQALHLLGNDPFLPGKIYAEDGIAHRLSKSKATAEAIVKELFLRTLSRPPSPQEMRVTVQHIQRHKGDRRQAVENVLWALLNHREFMFQH